MIISRTWAMPDKWTFKIKPIAELLKRYNVGPGWADPFAGMYSPAQYTNDIEGRCAKSQIDGLLFLKRLRTNIVDGCLFDPPYSVEMCLRKYKPRCKGTAGRTEYWTECKKQISRIVKPGGLGISFGWDSTGVSKKRGFEIIEVLLICHGACHNDTIVTIDRKMK